MLTVGVNSYISLTEANAYFGGRYNSERWQEANETEKEQAILTATRRIDRQKLKGRKVTAEQPLAFPRMAFGTVCEAPPQVKDAVCEEALALMVADTTRLQRIAEGVQSVKIGDASETYSAQYAMRTDGLLSMEAEALLSHWLVGTVPIT